ncbi:MAG TPA: tyrosine-type recombinase/integrase [Xanthobacteraceae bacterium]
MKLTSTNVRALKAEPGKTETVFFDDDVKGFGVRAKATGARSYVMCWKIAGEHRRVTIGSITDIDFGKAKERAKDIKADVRRGDDPAAEIKTNKLDAAKTYEALAEQFLDTLRDRYRPRAFKEIERHLTKNAADLNKRSVSRITRQDIAAVIEKVTANSGAVTANRTRTSLSTFFSWAMQRGHADTNPVIGTEKNPEQSRERVLTPAELRLVWNAAGDDDYGSIIKLLALTGQRESEIGNLCRSEINEGLIILPAERTKNRRPHVIPLSPSANTIIEARERRDGRDLIFGRGDGGFSGWSKSKERLDERITAANGGKAITHWTLHDLRRTFATYAGGGVPAHQFGKLPARDKELAHGLGVLPHVIEAILNHVSGHKAGVAQIYNRSTYEKEKRAALETWATHLQTIIVDAGNVTPIRRKA